MRRRLAFFACRCCLQHAYGPASKHFSQGTSSIIRISCAAPGIQAAVAAGGSHCGDGLAPV
jgi:hypothetical protein